jgi:hypothetical protein
MLARAEHRLAEIWLAVRAQAVLTQVDAHRRAERCGDVEPADVVRRGGAQADLVGPLGAAAGREVQVVAGAPVVSHREQLERNQVGVPQAQPELERRGAEPPHGDESRAGAGMSERHEVQIAADALVVKRNRQPHRDEPVSRIPIRALASRFRFRRFR